MNNFRNMCTAREVDIKKMANALGLSNSTISAFYYNQRKLENASYKTVVKIATYLGVKAEDII